MSTKKVDWLFVDPRKKAVGLFRVDRYNIYFRANAAALMGLEAGDKVLFSIDQDRPNGGGYLVRAENMPGYEEYAFEVIDRKQRSRHSNLAIVAPSPWKRIVRDRKVSSLKGEMWPVTIEVHGKVVEGFYLDLKK